MTAHEERFRILYESFIRGIKPGTKVEVYMNLMEENDRSLGQLSKIHAMCRRLATHTGESLEEVKRMVKIKAGLYRVTGTSDHQIELLSFGEASKDQISFAIQSCMEMGVIVGADL